MQKVIFLDCDGVMIPSSFLLVEPTACRDRKFPQTTIAVLNEMLKRTDALIVLNSSQSAPVEGKLDLDEALIFHGIPPRSFHASVRTRTPVLARDQAIEHWQVQNGKVDWIALDDSNFTDDPRLILVDPQAGLHIGHLDQVLDHWHQPPCLLSF